MSTRGHLHTVDVVYLGKTPRAWMISTEEEGPEIFVPKSTTQLSPDEDLTYGQVVSLTAPEWILIEKGLI